MALIPQEQLEARTGAAPTRAVGAVAAVVALLAIVIAASDAASDAASVPGPAPCRDSGDPVCGPFRWDPAPVANQPLVITVEVAPARPRAGEEVTVRVVATDPDAPVTTNGGTYFWDDPHDPGAQIGFPSTIRRGADRFGPWTPPSPRPGRLETAFTHTFSEPGTFRFHFAARSGDEADAGNRDRHPYADAAEASATITVAPPGG